MVPLDIFIRLRISSNSFSFFSINYNLIKINHLSNTGPNIRKQSQYKFSPPCQYLQIPSKMFGYHEVPSDPIKYLSVHKILRYLHWSSNTLFGGGLWQKPRLGVVFEGSFHPHHSHEERSLAYSAFQFRLAATGSEKRLRYFSAAFGL